MRRVDPNIKPLLSDLNETELNLYLASSDFDRLAIKKGFSAFWDKALNEYIKKNSKRNTSYKQGEKVNIEVFKQLAGKTYSENKNVFFQFIFFVLIGYIKWSNKQIDMKNIILDLKLVNFPKKYLSKITNTLKVETDEVKRLRKILPIKNVGKDSTFTTLIQSKLSGWNDLLVSNEWNKLIGEVKSIATIFNKESVLEEINIQSFRLANLNKKKRLNTISLEDEQIELNKINLALYQLVNSLK